MSIFNLGLQGVGVMCKSKVRASSWQVQEFRDLKAAAVKNKDFKAITLDSIALKVLLTQPFNRLQLKEENFRPIIAASKPSIEEVWDSVQESDLSLALGEPLMHRRGL